MNTPKTILLTGCSSGIGFCAAVHLKKQGWQVFATVRKKDDQSRLEAHGIATILMDLNDSASIINAVQTLLTQTGGQLSALCNNAGFGQPGAIEDITREVLRTQFETNVFGLQELTNQILPIMRRQGYGRIINISSILGLMTMAYRGAYCASKYALESLSDGLRLELQGSGIFVSLIEPGPIRSEFRNRAEMAYKQHIHPENSVHKDSYLNLIRNMERLKKDSIFTLSPEAVVKKIQHALESKHPKIRYRVTFPAYVLALLKRFLPDTWMDGILRRIMKSETIEASTKKSL